MEMFFLHKHFHKGLDLTHFFDKFPYIHLHFLFISYYTLQLQRIIPQNNTKPRIKLISSISCVQQISMQNNQLIEFTMFIN